MMCELTPEQMTQLQAIAQKFNTTVEHLWGILTKQGLVEGIYYLIISLIGVVILSAIPFTLSWLGKQIEKDDNKAIYGNPAEGWMILTVFYTIISLVAGFAMIIVPLYFAITGLINPEYFAVKQLLTIFK